MTMSEHELARALELAAQNVKRGVIREPRAYFADFAIPGANPLVSVVPAPPDIFRNGEDYPVRIHSLTAIVRPELDEEEADDERLIQQIGLRTFFHGAYYMRSEFVALPLWQSGPVGAAHALSFGQSSWHLHTPFVLSARDSMVVQARLNAAPSQGANREVTFAMTGIGLDSRRPYFLSSTQARTVTLAQPLDADDYRNDGDEPILITDLSAHCSAESTAQNPQGDIRRLELQVRQNGNGTNAEWFNGEPGAFMNAGLMGLESGRALVHHFPGEGLLWEPGESLGLEVQALATAAATAVVTIALVGTIEVV